MNESNTVDTLIAEADINNGIQLFTLENSKGTKLIVSNIGAAVISLFVKDKYGIMQDVVLGYENTADYLTDEFYLGTVVGRYANRIAGSVVVIDNQTYKLATKNGEYHLHGGKEGFNKKFFEAFPFQSDNATGIVFKYKSLHLEEGFPGNLDLEVTYTLEEENAWTVEYKAVSDKNTLINLTQHVYFNLSGNPSKKLDGHYLKLNSLYYLPVNTLQVPTGKFEDVRNSPFDFTELKLITKDIGEENEQLKLSNGYDHSFVLDNANNKKLKLAATVQEESTSLMMNVFTTEPSVHLYTGNFLDNINGKNNQIYNKNAGFCLETQHFPDAPNHAHFPSTILKAGEQFYSKTIFKFSIA